MGLSNIENKTKYLSIKEGKIWLKEQSFDCFEGYLKDIKERTRTFRNEEKTLLDFHFIDDEQEEYILSSSKTSGTTRSLLNYLSYIEDEKMKEPIKIITYLNKDNNLTKLQSYYGSNKLDWKYKDWKEFINICDEVQKNIITKLN